MSQNTLDELARLILRLVLGVLIFLHGWAKIRSGIGGIEAMLAMKGLPGFFAWGVYVGEVLAPILLIAGIWSRMAAALIAINMLVAVFLAHMGHLGQFTSSGGWQLELQAMFFVAALALMMLGAGRYSVAGRSGRWN
ncbi:MAG TPA: DoxX family protein [Burkholderiaceae bacterium]|nr:DoxX family protein [Burkholderiaceae bacterium]